MGRKSRSKQEGGAAAAGPAAGFDITQYDPRYFPILRLIADMKKDSIASINTVGADRFEQLLKAIFL